MELKDSGNRREFSSGAVRDSNEGKGRCDLLPLDVLGELYDSFNKGYVTLDDLAQCLWEEAGIKLEKKK